jgi:predicted CXXCH cytochrome family protein
MKFSLAVPMFLPVALLAAGNAYVGRDVCAGCHKSIAAAQATTAMARTWQGPRTSLLPKTFQEKRAEGPDPKIEYRVTRNARDFGFTVQMPGSRPQQFPIWTTMGGTRHGLSFLFRVADVQGVPLTRAPLVEGRYLHYFPADRLELSPGFPTDKPSSYETAFGRVLAPGFEKKCLACHGEPRKLGSHSETGVTCESCHGPGARHLTAVGAHAADKQIINPARLPVAKRMQPCAQCHSGFSVVEDPLPNDLLISDQVTSLSNSECWRQSGGNVACTNCHDPHQDAPRAVVIRRSETTCLSCHSVQAAGHAAICPVNQRTGCVGCHMPDAVKPPLHVADHWIRVHTDKPVTHQENRPEWRTRVTPKHLYLRMIAVDKRPEAENLRNQLSAGGSFFDLARANSKDPNTAKNGGFLGDVAAGHFDPSWSHAALSLRPGELSGVVETNGRYVVLQRMPRNFREEAETHYNKAMDLRKNGLPQQSAAELLEALKIYPHLLRALTYLGVAYGEAGNSRAGAQILTLATELYPQDAGAHFNLGIALGALGSEEEIAEYKRALAIDPDLVTAYLNIGAAYYAKGRYDEAIQMYRRGIEANPLAASLHYSLGAALQQQGKAGEAQKEMMLAVKIDPKFAHSTN